jgi:choline transport protein
MLTSAGWMSTLSWQAGTAAGPFLVGTIIQALITVNNENYVPKNWQGTLLVWAATVPIFIINVWGSRAMPLIQNVMLGVHIFGFLAVVLTLWILAPRNTAEVVFTQFTNEGGWSTMGLSLMVGQISAIYGLICMSS